MKKLIIIRAAKDICNTEIEHIKIVSNMFGIESQLIILDNKKEFSDLVPKGAKYDYVYLAAHSDLSGFGEADGSFKLNWCDWAASICQTECLNPSAILLLGCCRGGLKGIGYELFKNCSQIDYVCGPRWTVTSHDISIGFHVFLYNMEIRREQPSTAVHRASLSTGYDFFCHDRAELDDVFYSC